MMRSRLPAKSKGTLGSVAAATVTKDMVARGGGGPRGSSGSAQGGGSPVVKLVAGGSPVVKLVAGRTRGGGKESW